MPSTAFLTSPSRALLWENMDLGNHILINCDRFDLPGMAFFPRAGSLPTSVDAVGRLFPAPAQGLVEGDQVGVHGAGA
jgi:hypothetical protein